MADLTHIDEQGNARMVDVSDKEVSQRSASAEALVRLSPDAYAALKAGTLKKGDALGVARVAGIMAAKRTSDLIPLCHPLPISGATVAFELNDETCSVRIETWVRVTSRTGVEMEALTAASVAALTIYDMCKAIDKGIVVERMRLLEKSGGASGDFRADRREPT
jgi:cyclic pyranopterin phosphate synthase